MADEFAQLQRELAVGQAEIARRERVASDAARAEMVKRHRAAADAASARRQEVVIAKAMQAMNAMAPEIEALARQLNPGAALKEKIEQARRGEALALAQGRPELAMKLESHRLQFERQLGGG